MTVCLQANAEPDMKQTGDRLKPLIGDLVEGVLQLVADAELNSRQEVQIIRLAGLCSVNVSIQARE